MAKTYAQLTQEIDALKAHAESVRQREKAGVAARIRDAITVYGLTADELGFGKAAGPGKAPTKSSDSKTAASTAATSTNAKVKYRDDAGNAWGGRGPKPKWLQAGLASGRSLESFAANQGKERSAGAAPTGRGAAMPQPGPATKKAKQKKYKSVVKYRDGAGHQWSGRGPKPGWVTAALDGGKTLEQLAA
jgi:DNA-binding protein H-NS